MARDLTASQNEVDNSRVMGILQEKRLFRIHSREVYIRNPKITTDTRTSVRHAFNSVANREPTNHYIVRCKQRKYLVRGQEKTKCQVRWPALDVFR